VIESDEPESRSCVSAIGPLSELSIGRTPKATLPAAASAATAEKLGSGTSSAAGKSAAAAEPLWAPFRPGYATAEPAAGRGMSSAGLQLGTGGSDGSWGMR
jgi:hypothetical protein